MTVGEFREYIKNVSDDMEIMIEKDKFVSFKKCDSYCENIYDENAEGKRKNIIVIFEIDE